MQDDGKGFQPSTRGESKKNRGGGLKLSRALVAEEEIDTGLDGTVVHMVKFLEGGPARNEGADGKEEGGAPPETE